VWLDAVQATREELRFRLLTALRTELGEQTVPHVVSSSQEGGFGFVAFAGQAGFCKNAWVRVVSSPAWSDVVEHLDGQPTVHILLADGLVWDASEGMVQIVELTRRDPLQPKRVATRALLPTLRNIDIWPVIGHSGRLLARIVQPSELSAAAVAEASSPLAEPIRTWSGLEKCTW